MSSISVLLDGKYVTGSQEITKVMKVLKMKSYKVLSWNIGTINIESFRNFPPKNKIPTLSRLAVPNSDWPPPPAV